jgi:hypothetical protein
MSHIFEFIFSGLWESKLRSLVTLRRVFWQREASISEIPHGNNFGYLWTTEAAYYSVKLAINYQTTGRHITQCLYLDTRHQFQNRLIHWSSKCTPWIPKDKQPVPRESVDTFLELLLRSLLTWLIKGIMFAKSNGDVFISYDHLNIYWRNTLYPRSEWQAV